MAPPTKPFNQAATPPGPGFVAPPGLSRVTVPNGGSVTITFQSLTSYVRIATEGAELEIAWTAAGAGADAKNGVGGGWPNPWALPGQFDRVILTDPGTGGGIDADLAVVADKIDVAAAPTDKTTIEGATEAHANA